MTVPLACVSMSRRDAEATVFDYPVISIATPNDVPAIIQAPKVLRLWFHDLDLDRLRLEEPAFTEDNCFDPRMARSILNFARHEPRLAVHCDAGWSRSTAVRAALTEWRNGAAEWRHTPNGYVLRLLREAIAEEAKP